MQKSSVAGSTSQMSTSSPSVSGQKVTPLLQAHNPEAAGSGKLVISFILGLLIGAGSMWLGMSGNRNTNAPESSDSTAGGSMMNDGSGDSTGATADGSMSTVDMPTPITDVAMGSTPALRVPAVQQAGSMVTVESVTFPSVEGGWVVVHEDNNGELGNALGAQRFGEGSWSGMVSLLRDTASDKTYRAVLYKDNGDGQFSLETDRPLIDSEGKIIMVPFQVTK